MENRGRLMKTAIYSALIACISFCPVAALAQQRPANGSLNPGEKVIFDNPKCRSGKGYVIGGSRQQGIRRKEGCVPGKARKK